jgi:hypothetical protein
MTLIGRAAIGNWPQLAISKWQLAKPTAKPLTTEDAENQQLAIGNWQNQLQRL